MICLGNKKSNVNVITLIINKFIFNFSRFSLGLAVIYGLVSLTLDYCTIKTFEYASLSVYTIFSMISGMALPFIYGLIQGEDLKITKIICFLLIVFSILLTVDKGKNSMKAFPYYMGVFLLNGSVGVRLIISHGVMCRQRKFFNACKVGHGCFNTDIYVKNKGV